MTDEPPPPRRPYEPPRFFHLTPAELLSLVVAAASLCVAALGLANSLQNHDTSNAVKKLADLAAQTKRQADASEQQLAQIKAQVAEAHAQTKTLSAQTDAIKETAGSAARAATAQQQTAETTARSYAPDVAMSTLMVSGIGRAADPKDQLEHFNFSRVVFTNTGGSILTVMSTTYAFVVSAGVPLSPPAIYNLGANGNEVIVVPKAIWYTDAPGDVAFPTGTGDALNNGTSSLYSFAKIVYRDQSGLAHQRCLAYVMKVPAKTGPDMTWDAFKEVRHDPSHC